MSEPATPGPSPPDNRIGMIGEAVAIVKGMTLTNVLIIALLVAIAIPSYVFYRTLNDASMLNKFMSYYEEISSAQMPCTMRVASQRGAEPVYSISTGFAFQGSDRWTVGVIMQRLPDPSAQVAYCETLNLLVDHLRRPNAPEPTFPGTDEPMIWHYQPPEQP